MPSVHESLVLTPSTIYIRRVISALRMWRQGVKSSIVKFKVSLGTNSHVVLRDFCVSLPLELCGDCARDWAVSASVHPHSKVKALSH